MNDSNELVNRVAQSGLITIKLEEFYPEDQILEFDLKPYLFQGLILREIEFRKALKEIDWSVYKGAYLSLYCSSDAIIPTWAYMLVTSYASPFVKGISYGSKDQFLQSYFRSKIREINPEDYRDAKIVIKGCSDREVPVSAYIDITSHLMDYASSIMYGEPCSTVPVFKKKKVE